MTDLSSYYLRQQEIRTGDHLGFSGSGIIPYLIKKFSYSRNPLKWRIPDGTINHSAMAIRLRYPGLEKRRYTTEALNKGLEFHMLSRRLDGYNGKVYWYPLKDEYDDRRNMIACWLFDNIDVPYDYKSLFKQAVASVNSDMKLLFCSEAANFAYQYAGIKTGFPVENGVAPTPADIDKFDIFKDKVRIL